jgi:hypothetical protein
VTWERNKGNIDNEGVKVKYAERRMYGENKQGSKLEGTKET